MCDVKIHQLVKAADSVSLSQIEAPRRSEGGRSRTLPKMDFFRLVKCSGTIAGTIGDVGTSGGLCWVCECFKHYKKNFLQNVSIVQQLEDVQPNKIWDSKPVFVRLLHILH